MNTASAVTATPVLDHAGIAARVPHAGTMCLLDAMLACDERAIHCTATGLADPDHPLRLDGVLPAACAIEYAAQAMALHGAMNAAPGAVASPGFLASARQVRLLVPRLDDLAGPLHVHALHLAGDGGQALYRFELRADDGRLLVDGRAAVVLNSPLPLPPTAAPGATR